MINWDRIAELKNDFGVDDFDEIVALFMEEVDGCFAELTRRNGSFAEHLHFIKGSAANLGFSSLQKLCETLEDSMDTDEIPHLEDVYQQSKSAFLSGLEHKEAS